MLLAGIPAKLRDILASKCGFAVGLRTGSLNVLLCEYLGGGRRRKAASEASRREEWESEPARRLSRSRSRNRSRTA